MQVIRMCNKVWKNEVKKVQHDLPYLRFRAFRKVIRVKFDLCSISHLLWLEKVDFQWADKIYIVVIRTVIQGQVTLKHSFNHEAKPYVASG